MAVGSVLGLITDCAASSPNIMILSPPTRPKDLLVATTLCLSTEKGYKLIA